MAADVEDTRLGATPSGPERSVLPAWFGSAGGTAPASTSPPLRVKASPLFDGEHIDQIVVESAPNQSGTEVVSQTLSADQSLTLWAAGYLGGSYVADQSVNWVVTGGIGFVIPATGVSTTFSADVVGTGTIIATHPTTDTITDTVGTITVTAGALHHFALDAPGSGTAGIGFTTVITTQDADGNTVASLTGDVALSMDGGDIQPTEILSSAFSGGVWTGPITLTLAGNRTVTATSGSAVGADSLAIDPNSPTHLAYTAAPASTTAGVESGLFNVQRRDAYSNPVTSSAAIVDLSTSSTGGNAQFHETSGGTAVSSVTINDGDSSVSFYYYDELAGSHTLTASAAGLSDALTVLAVDPALATQFLFSAVADLTAGQSGTVAVLTALDAFDNVDTSYTGAHSLNWSGLGDAPGGQPPAYPVNPVDFAAGVASSLVFTPYRAQVDISLVVTELVGLQGTSNPFTVSAADLDHVVVTPTLVALNPGQTQQFSAQGYDGYSNYVSGVSYAWSVINGGGTISATGGLFTAAVTDAVYLDTVQVTASPGDVTGTATVTVNNVGPTANAGGPYSDDEGSWVIFSGSGSDGNNDPLTYEWDLDYNGSNFTVDHTGATTTTYFSDNLSRQVAFRVTDDDGVFEVQATTLTILNAAPVVTATADLGADEGQLLDLQVATFSDEGSGDTHVAEIDWGDGTVGPGTVAVGAVTGSHTYTDDGAYTAVVTVTDDDGGAGWDSFVVTVSNVAPAVTATADLEADEGQLLDLQVATFSDEGSGDTHVAEIDWGDGTVEPGTVGAGVVTGAHTYTDDGAYTAVVTVTDDDGGAGWDSFVVTVSNVAPAVTATADLEADEGQLLDLQVATFADEGSADTHSAQIDWGDGAVEPGAVGVGVVTGAHTYADDGAYTVVVTVTDDDGGADWDTFAITVSNVAPTADAGNDKDALEGALVPFNGTITDPGTADTHDVEWDFGDGSVVTGTLTPSHGYADNGTYVVTLTVRDDDGGEGSDWLTMNVFNVAPTVLVAGDQLAYEGDVMAFNGVFNDPGTADTHEIEWAFGDGAVFTGALAASHVYTAAGAFAVTLTVRDDDGGEGSDSLMVTVLNVPPTAVISGPLTQTAGLDTIFDAFGSTEPGQNITAYGWDLDDDGLYDDDFGVTTTLNLTTTGVYTVGLRVTDAESTTGTDQVAITIVPAPLDHFVVAVPPSGTAGVGFITVITAEDVYDNVITAWDENVILTTTNGGIMSPSMALGDDFVNGVWIGSVSLTAADDLATPDDDRDVIASYNGHAGQDTLHIEPAAARQLAFSTIGQQEAGAIAYFSLTARDPFGNQDTNYDGSHTLGWSGLMTSPNGTAPEYPSTSAYFFDGVAFNLDFIAYNANTNVTLSASEGSGPEGTSNPFTVTHSTASAFSFSTIGTQTAGSPGTVDTLTARDDYGNQAIVYAGPYTLTWSGLGDSPDGHPPEYPVNPVDFDSGLASSLVFTPYLAETGVSLGASAGGVSGESNSFDVNVGSSVDAVIVESEAGGAGSKVTGHDMVVRETFAVYAAGYDVWGNYIADQPVVWSGTGVALDRLSPLSGISTALTPVISGTGTIVAEFTAAITDATGLITVRAPLLDVILSDSIEPVEAGETLTYTILYSNVGNANATDTVLTLTLDSNLVGLSASPPGSGSGQVWTWDLGEVVTGTLGRVIVTCTAASPLDSGTVLRSVVEIDSYQTDVVSDSEETTVHSQPVLHIAKSDAPDPVQAGNSIFYTLVFTNSGNMNATGIVITDFVPANTAFVWASGGGVHASGVVTWSLGVLEVGVTPQRTLIVDVNRPLPIGTVITNSGYWINGAQTAPVIGPDVTTDIHSPSLRLSKIGGPSPVEAGALVTFTVFYSNTGDGVASSVLITDVLPGEVSFLWASHSGTEHDGVVTWPAIPTLEADESGQRTVVARVNSPLVSGTVLLNQGFIDSAEGDPVSDLAAVVVHSEPEVSIVKTDALDPVQAGDELVYTIAFTNTGNADATGVVVTDVLPTYASFDSASDGGTHDDGVVTWDLGVLPGEGGVDSVVLTVTVTSPLTNGTVLENLAFIAGSEGGQAQDDEQTEVASSPHFFMDMADSPDPVQAGDELVYTIVFTNTGNANATGVVVTDVLPTYVSFDSASDGGTHDDGVVTWDLGTVAGEGGTGYVVLTVTVTSPLTDGTALENMAYIGSAEGSYGQSDEQTQVASSPQWVLEVADSSDPVQAGGELVYTIAFTNTGNADATGVVMTDVLPMYTTFLSASDGGTHDDGVVTWDLGVLAGEGAGFGSVVLAVTVASPLINGTVLENTAHIASVEGGQDQSAEQTTVASSPGLAIGLESSPGPVQAGDELVYTISYTNAGNADATGVVVTDALPIYTTFASASDGGTHDDGVATWDLGVLAGEGGVGTVSLTVTVRSPLTNGTALENTAYIASAEGSWAQSLGHQTIVSSSPVLHIDAIDTPDPVKGGATLVYTVFYSNTGNANGTTMHLTCDYDPRLAFVSASNDGADGGGVVTWSLPFLPGEGGNGTVAVTLTTAALAPADLLQSAFHLSSAEGSEASVDEMTVVEAVDLRLSVSPGGAEDAPHPGEWITYTLYYTNDGNIPSTGVALTATLPEGTTYVDVGQDWAHAGGRYYRYGLASVDSGESGSVQFTVQVDGVDDGEGGTLLPPGLTSIEASFAIADDGQNGPEFNIGDNQASISVGIPDLVVGIRVMPELPMPNCPVTFTVIITNQGTGRAWNPNNRSGFYVDLFIDPDLEPTSYPWNGDGDRFAPTTPLSPGTRREIVFVLDGLSDQDHVIYAKVDNYRNPDLEPWQRNSLVPESDEENNVASITVVMGEPEEYYIFLPVVLNNH